MNSLNNHIEEMKQLIRSEIQSINSLEERVIFKELMEGVFLSLYETNVQMYRALEQRVMDDLSYDINRYEICTGLVERRFYDHSNHIMAAMFEEDITPLAYTASEIRAILKEKGEFCLTTVFLKCDALKITSVLSDKTYTGVIRDLGEYKINVRLSPSHKYLDKVEYLYHLFLKNGIPWQTVNCPYLYKMADVVITGLPEDLPDGRLLTDLFIDFEEYNSIVNYDMVPIWNVWDLVIDSVGFPIACEDHENYEHVISINEYGAEHAYLIDEKSGIKKIRQNGEKLLVTGKTSKSQKWNIYTIRRSQESKIDRYAYPLMVNIRKDGFTERYQKKCGQMIKTRGELERFIRGFGLEEYIEYQDCSLENVENETYSMNSFMEDEIREREGSKKFILYFQASGKEQWLSRDLVSFIASEVQELYPEYQCGGKLV